MRLPRFVPLPWSVVNALVRVTGFAITERGLRDREDGLPCGCTPCVRTRERLAAAMAAPLQLTPPPDRSLS